MLDYQKKKSLNWLFEKLQTGKGGWRYFKLQLEATLQFKGIAFNIYTLFYIR